MGCFGDNSTEAKNSREIEEQIKNDKKKSKFEAKLLLLGAGESGKTTILRQMKLIHDNGYSQEEKEYYKEIVQSNVMSSMRQILIGMEKLGIIIPDRLESYKQAVIDEDSPINFDAVRELWKESSVKEAVTRSREYQLIDSATYFLDNLAKVSQPDYMPDNQDILRCRVKTTGISETKFKVGELIYTMVDVGGQRSERRKWVHCFENVTAVLFVVAASSYDQTLIEDESVNRMHEALTLFDNICNGQWFVKTSMIVFLNKIDILKQKLGKSMIENYFSDYTGDNSFDDAMEFFTNKFKELNQTQHKQVYFHQTCATDTSQIQFVMAADRKSVV